MGETLRSKVDGLKLKLDEKAMDYDQLKQECDGLRERSNSDKEKIERLGEAMRRMADELDVARAKGVELTKMEATVDKYKKKLDDMAHAKHHIMELEEQNSKYLEQVRWW